MTYELIITEKPNAAKMIAAALANGKPIKELYQGAPYYKITRGKKDIIVGCAVGHLYSVAEKEKSFKYPMFELAWKSSADIDPESFTKKYISALKKIAKDATEFTIATDYDIEGEVIGLNVVRFICKQKDANRMKFSTLTKDDLIEAYEKKSKTLDWGQANAGETRHFMDWMYGINMSRALTLAIKSTGMFKIMSSGRVQGPALKLVVEKEKEISAFKSEKYWQIELKGNFQNHKEEMSFWHEKDKLWSEEETLNIVRKIKDKNGSVKKIQTAQFMQKTPVPFDLTTLQTEAYRFFGISPKQTLDIAQELYTSGAISYPRTSSQKLPKELGFKKILDALSKNPAYTALAKDILKTALIPSEGKKTDPAHPAIYPTGVHPKIADRQHKIYDLIVKRFLACFAPDAKRETVTIYIDVEKESFLTRGTRTLEHGWHKFYPFTEHEEHEMPKVKENDVVVNKEVIKYDKETQPPKRYTPASIIRELEKQNLGTKATRATIVDSLYQRSYVKNESIQATELGMQTIETLEKYCPEILDEKLTRHFENEMEKIRQNKLKEEDVLKEVQKTLTKILEKFKKNEKSIGTELGASHRQSMETASLIGKCPKCVDGTLKVMYSKKSKRKFIACDKYPECKTIMNMPSFGKVQNTTKICEHCKFPIIKILAGKKTREICLNHDCPTKQSTDEQTRIEIQKLESGELKKICPKCGSPLMLRKSVYGQFIGCSTFPKCRHIEKVPRSEEERLEMEKRKAFFASQKDKPKKIKTVKAKKEVPKVLAMQDKKLGKKKTVKKVSKTKKINVEV